MATLLLTAIENHANMSIKILPMKEFNFKEDGYLMVKYEVFHRDEKIGTLLTDGPRRDRFFPEEAIKHHYDIMILPEWKTVKDTGWIYIPLFENMIHDTMRQNPNAKYIARFTNDYVLVKQDEVTEEV